MFPILVNGADPNDPLWLIQSDVYPNQPYCQGWNNIVVEIQNRLQKIPMCGPVHRFICWVKENPDNNEWQQLFTFRRPGDEQEVVSTWLLNAATSPGNITSTDNSIWFTRRTQIELHGIYQLDDPTSFFVWNEILRQVTNSFREGDRTFNKTCLTYQLPDPVESATATFCNVDVHSAIFRFQIEESGKLAGYV